MHMSRRRILLAGGALVALLAGGFAAFAQSDPLPSWNDGEAKSALIDVVAKVTKEGGADYVAPAVSADRSYGVPPEQVVGSSGVVKSNSTPAANRN
jgi:hypothetical protein